MSTLEHFFKSTSKVASTGKKRGSYATISEELKAK
jgi:hypothetical protein